MGKQLTKKEHKEMVITLSCISLSVHLANLADDVLLYHYHKNPNNFDYFIQLSVLNELAYRDLL